jgi:hypothetical protein
VSGHGDELLIRVQQHLEGLAEHFDAVHLLREGDDTGARAGAMDRPDRQVGRVRAGQPVQRRVLAKVRARGLLG